MKTIFYDQPENFSRAVDLASKLFSDYHSEAGVDDDVAWREVETYFDLLGVNWFVIDKIVKQAKLSAQAKVVVSPTQNSQVEQVNLLTTDKA